jgi:acetyl-CoA acetyltransferase
MVPASSFAVSIKLISTRQKIMQIIKNPILAVKLLGTWFTGIASILNNSTTVLLMPSSKLYLSRFKPLAAKSTTRKAGMNQLPVNTNVTDNMQTLNAVSLTLF